MRIRRKKNISLLLRFVKFRGRMKLIIDKKVSIGFIAALLALVSLIFFSFKNQENHLLTTKNIIKQNLILYCTEQIQKNILEVESSIRGYAITGDSVFLEHYLVAGKAVDKNLGQLAQTVANTQQNRRLMSRLTQIIKIKTEFSNKTVEARHVSFELAQKLIGSYQGKEGMDEIRAITGEFQRQATHEVNMNREIRDQVMGRFNLTFATIIGTSVVLLAVLFVHINQSIITRARSEEKVRQLNTELEAFSYSVSHDLRSPLRVIDGYSLILEEDYSSNLDDEGKNTVSVIIKNVRKMGRLIDDLLEFSHLGRKAISPARIDFTPMVTRLCEDLKTQARCENCQIKINDLDPAFADIKLIEQVWVNLISNAIKYSMVRQHPVIEIGSFKKHGSTCFYVRDNGVGFDMNFKHKLFGVFQRLHRPEDFAGTGVGLAIVKRIITRHDGQVWAESTLNEGATFYFSLPIL
jgi:signal transduction histidine kinase